MARKKKPTPKTQACTVCGYPRKFIRMRERIGKDDRVARWPEYEKCPNKNDPSKHPTAKNESYLLDEELRKDPRLRKSVNKAVEHKEMPVGRLLQVQNKADPLDEISDCLLWYEDNIGGLPIAIGVNREEAGDYTSIEWELEDGSTVTIPVWHAKLAVGYGYIYLIQEVS